MLAHFFPWVLLTIYYIYIYSLYLKLAMNRWLFKQPWASHVSFAQQVGQVDFVKQKDLQTVIMPPYNRELMELNQV